jgi:hypothetical protein
MNDAFVGISLHSIDECADAISATMLGVNMLHELLKTADFLSTILANETLKV